MLAKKADAPFDSEQHLFEIKWDGVRCLAFIEARQVRLQSRQLTNLTLHFPELVCLHRLPSGTVLDGELVVLERGLPSLASVQQRALLQDRQRIQWLSRRHPVTYMLFDLLFLRGKPLMTAPFSFRREQLKLLLERMPIPGVVATEGVPHRGRQLFAEVMRLGLEGIMAKHLEGPYLPGKRSVHWLKIKPSTPPGNRPQEPTQLSKWSTTKPREYAAGD